MSRPSLALFLTTFFFGCVLTSFLAAYAFGGVSNSGFTGLLWSDIGIIWGYNIGCMFVLDIFKLAFKFFFEIDGGGLIGNFPLL